MRGGVVEKVRGSYERGSSGRRSSEGEYEGGNDERDSRMRERK